ncbi:MAG: glucose-6-phosphate isomerase, partial [Bdellovibrionales bacterium]|nr:glucose-6-phosphate isomerase [Bdellovibrionales bacterium]
QRGNYLELSQQDRVQLWQNPPGYIQLLNKLEVLEGAVAYGKEIAEEFEHLAVVGMGGSSLGSKALIEALGYEEKVSFFLDTDPRYFQKRIKTLDLLKTHWIVVSKSGTTLEILALVNAIVEQLGIKGLSLERHITVLTEPKESPLKEWAIKNKITCVDHPLDIGGRFSVLSPVGMVPCAFAGLDVSKFYHGAQWVYDHPEVVEQFCAQIMESFDREEFITVFWFYSLTMESFGLWLNQLWAESLAKKVKISGEEAPRVSTPYSCIGARDQHSVLQQIAEGYKDKLVCFFQVDHWEDGNHCNKNEFVEEAYLSKATLSQIYNVQALSTSEALLEKGVNQLYFNINQLDESSLGALIFFFETSIGVLGKLLGINPYDQPGVEAGKKIAKEKLLSVL